MDLTPVKAVLLPREGSAIATIDGANYSTLLATAPTREQAEWLAWTISRHHKVPVIGEDEYQQMVQNASVPEPQVRPSAD